MPSWKVSQYDLRSLFRYVRKEIFFLGEKPFPPSEGAISKEIMYCDCFEHSRRSKNLNFSNLRKCTDLSLHNVGKTL